MLRRIQPHQDRQAAQECDRCAHDPPHRLPDLPDLPQNGRMHLGWGKQHGTMRKTKHRGTAAVAADFMLNLIAYNLVRIPKLIAA